MNTTLLQRIKYNKHVIKFYSNIIAKFKQSIISIDVPEVRSLECCSCSEPLVNVRLNLLVPSINPKDVFGGIATALSFFLDLVEELQCDSRIIITDREYEVSKTVLQNKYEYVDADTESICSKQIIDMSSRLNKLLYVGDKDVFVATSWWTAYILGPIMEWQAKEYKQIQHPLFYFIQDFEPGFYPWSSRYLMAESTYKMENPVFAIFNSKLLFEYFEKKGYNFYKQMYFEPILNKQLKEYLQNIKIYPKRKKQILIYGRPGTARNAFELIIEAFREWIKLQTDANEWTILSAGEKFSDINLGNNVKIKSVGKLSLEEYARIMLESKVGISLMVSPHPSYPPLEMATFGMRVITNSYDNKDLSFFSDNIVSIDNCSAKNLAYNLNLLCNDKYPNTVSLNSTYLDDDMQWKSIINEIRRCIEQI